MKILFGLIYLMDLSMHFWYIFLSLALAALAFSHHFLKKHEKIWSLLCALPMLTYIIFLINEHYADGAYSCKVSFEDGSEASFGLYADQGGALQRISEEGHIWLALHLDDEELWFY